MESPTRNSPASQTDTRLLLVRRADPAKFVLDWPVVADEAPPGLRRQPIVPVVAPVFLRNGFGTSWKTSPLRSPDTRRHRDHEHRPPASGGSDAIAVMYTTLNVQSRCRRCRSSRSRPYSLNQYAKMRECRNTNRRLISFPFIDARDPWFQ